MNASRKALQFAALALLAALAACSRVEGPSVTQTRTVAPFTAVEMRGSATLDVLVGPAQSVVVEADQHRLDSLQTRVQDGRLVIGTRDRTFWMREGELHVRLTVPTLESLAFNGAGRVSVHGFSGGRTSLILSGAGELEASGAVDRLVAQLNGAGSLDLRHLTASDAEVVVNGTGNIEVNATERLDATVNGVGSIDYLGSPRALNTAIHGVGSIEEHRAGH